MGRLVALAAFVVGVCGCGGDSLKNLTTPYVATWEITSGQDTPDCGNGPLEPTPVTGSVVIDVSADPGTLSARDTNHGTCVWILTASTVGASFRSGSECHVTSGGTDATVVPKDYLFVLSSTDLASASGATVDSTFDWTILDKTCRHTQHLILAR
jgi:hypothetical protein